MCAKIEVNEETMYPVHCNRQKIPFAWNCECIMTSCEDPHFLLIIIYPGPMTAADLHALTN